jgi:LemA protein
MSIILIVSLVLVFIILYGVFSYNGFIRLVNRGKEAWADIDVQLKRRYDLIPNLISTVKGYAQHEAKVFENVSEARSRAMSAGSLAEKGEAELGLTAALKSILAIAEAYPELKANQNFLELQKELSDTENKIQASRRFYNTVVRDLNTKIESVPANLIAKMFNFVKMEFFELSEEESAAKNPVAVKF